MRAGGILQPSSRLRVDKLRKKIRLTLSIFWGRLEQQDNEQKILGVRWTYVQDELIFDLNELAILISAIEPTKRHIVGVTEKFYNPLGLCPLSLFV